MKMPRILAAVEDVDCFSNTEWIGIGRAISKFVFITPGSKTSSGLVEINRLMDGFAMFSKKDNNFAIVTN
ncbi:MAG: hypothetical protein LBF25_00475 [Puniceicoccales bacterium]|nr:hypothetical protein [Puniceicoccales bacterium]